MKKNTIPDIIAFFFIFLFIYAAASKVIDHDKFRIDIGLSPLLTDIAGYVTWFIPILEISIAVLLAIERFRLIGLYAAFSLMTMFTAYIVAITRFSFFVPCSCGGIFSKMGWGQHLVFNTFFVVLGGLAVVLHHPNIHTLYNRDKRVLLQ